MISKILITTTVVCVSVPCFATKEKDENPTQMSSSSYGIMAASTLPKSQVVPLPVYSPITRADLTSNIINPDNIDYFFEVLEKVDENNRNEVGRLALEWIRPHMYAYNIEALVSALSRVPADERSMFIKQAQQLIRSDICNIENALYCLSCIPAAIRTQTFISQVQQLIGPDMCDGNEITALMVSFSGVPVEDRTQTFVDQVRQFITPDAHGREIEALIGSLARVPGDERPTFINQARQLCILSSRDINHPMSVVYTLSCIPIEDRTQTFINQVQQFITPGTYEEYGIATLIDSLARVPTNERPTFINQVQQFITPEMSEHVRKNIMDSFSDVPVNDRTQTFIDQVHQLIRSDENGSDTATIIWFLSRVPTAIRTQIFIDHLGQLIKPEMNKIKLHDIMKSFRYDVGGECIPEIVDCLQQLIRVNMDINDISNLVIALHENAAENRTQIFIDQLKQLIRPDMDGGKTRLILWHLSKAPAAIRTQEFIDHLKQLLGVNESTDDIRSLIDFFSRFPAENRTQTFIDQLKSLIRPDTRMYLKIDLARDLSGIPVAERSQRIARALLFMRGGNHAIARQALETPLEEELILGEMDDVAQGGNPYVAGVNVHAEGRDRRAIEALQSFYAMNPTLEELNEAYADFLSAVRVLEKSRQERVLRSLGIDESGNVLPKPANETFSGLITGVDNSGVFTLSAGGNRIKVNGRELIARLWNFANAFNEHERNSLISSSSASASSPLNMPPAEMKKDRANMREGIMNALLHGVNERNKLRCEMGRVQLLELAALQGRLRDAQGRIVDVDNLGLNPAKVTGPAPVAGVPAQPAMITNFNEIAHHLQPFMNSLGTHIATAEQFYTELFTYINRLADGDVLAGGERVLLDPASAVYFVRMMSPAVFSEGRLRVPASIDPQMSLVALLGFGDVFRIDDYVGQFGEQDQAQFAAARKIEEDRALIAQQNREYAAGLEQDQINAKKKDDAATIQRAEAEQRRVAEEKRHEDEAARPKTREELRALRLKAYEQRSTTSPSFKEIAKKNI